MTAPFFTTISATYQSLHSQIYDHLPLDAAPAQAAALRQALKPHLANGWRIHRGYLTDGEYVSPLLEGLLIGPQHDVLFHSQDLIITLPDAVHSIVHVLPTQHREQMEGLAKALAFWREHRGDNKGVAVAVEAQHKPHSPKSALSDVAQVSRSTEAERLDLVVYGSDHLFRYQSASSQWIWGNWRSKQNRPPRKPIALACALAQFLAPALPHTMDMKAWEQVDDTVFTQKEALALDTLPEAEASTSRPPSTRGEAAQATAPAKKPKATTQSQPTVTPERQQALHTPDQEGLYPLHHAVMASNAKKVQGLLAEGASTEVKDRDGYTPLHMATEAGALALVSVLLEKGADANNRTYAAATPLHLAIEQRNADIAEILIEHGAELEARNNRSKTPLHIAASNGSMECAEVLIAHRANLEAKMEKDIRPLHLAAWYGETRLAQFLIDKGADINAINVDGNTSLHFAAFNGQVRLIKTLISNRADMSRANRAGETYLQGINEGYQGEMVTVLG